MKKNEKNLLRSLDGSLAEFLEVLHEGQGGLTGACTGSLVSLVELSGGIHLEELDVLVDFFDKLFHDT